MADPTSNPTPAVPAAALPTGRRAWRALPLLLVWLLAAWPVVLWLVARTDPELAVRLAQVATTAAVRAALGAAVVLGLGLLLFPPFPAWLRLAAERVRLSFGSDRGPLLKALSELQHFESAARHLEVGRLALTRGELPLAAQHLARAVELDPSVAAANHQFGLLLFRVGQVAPARTAFERAEQLDPGHAFGNALLEAGRAALVLGAYDDAVRLLEAHRQRHGGSRKSHYWLAKARLAAGDRDGARAAMQYAAAPTTQRLTAEESWFRALARVALWRGGGP